MIANPGLDRYGSDLQMVQSVAALRHAGWDVTVVSPTTGPLADQLSSLGAEVVLLDYPLVQRADVSPGGALRLGTRALRALPGMVSLIRRLRPDVLYVNTVTLPWWLLAGRLRGVPVLCHVHEAEPNVSRLVGGAMAAQLWLARTVVVNSSITRRALTDVLKGLRRRIRLIYNGVPLPEGRHRVTALEPRAVRLVVVGRLSPRKSPHTAVEATALLRAKGIDARLELCGTPVEGRESYESELRTLATGASLSGAVTFSGYVQPVAVALLRNDVFLATSTAEPFGNAVVEAQLAGLPVVATAVEGHLETVLHDETGLHVPVGDAVAMAAAVERLLSEPQLASRLAANAHDRATTLFSTDQYDREIVDVVEDLTRR